MNNQIVGYILPTKISIKNGSKEWPSLALAPVAIDHDFQGREIDYGVDFGMKTKLLILN